MARKGIKGSFGKRSSLMLTGMIMLVILISLLSTSLKGFAQDGGLEWDDPVNISASGVSVNPHIIANDEEVFMVLWDHSAEVTGSRDARSGFSLKTPDGWSESKWVSLPFSGLNPEYLVDETRLIHVIWIDDEDTLRHHPASLANFSSNAGWYGSRNIGSAVVAFDAALDEKNRIHVVFISGDETVWGPAGVYYTRSTSYGPSWTIPLRLFESDYFQQYLGPVQFDPNPISPEPAYPSVDVEIIGIDEDQIIAVSWDNPSLKRIYESGSNDLGINWDPVVEVQGPNERSPYASPRRLLTISHQDELIRTWQILESGGNCTQVYQSSSDLGNTWSQVQLVFPDLVGCPNEFKALKNPVGDILLFATFQNQTYLVAWNGTEWSYPQDQQALTYFVDPETYNFVDYGCRSAEIVDGTLIVVGCDQGEGRDIWITQAPLESTEDWYGRRSDWIEGGSISLEPEDIYSLSLISDETNVIHSLMSHKSDDAVDAFTSVIEYTGWEDNGVIGPFPIHSNLPGMTRDLELSMDNQGGLSAFWSGSQAGEITYSRTSIKEAPSSAGWSEPVKFNPEGTPGRGPGLLWTDDQQFLVYAIPANEDRGVYLASSIDGGQTWEPSDEVFNAVTGDCSLVEAPALASTRNGDLHAIWTCSTLPGGVGPFEIVYARSEDNGKSWSPAEPIIEGSIISSWLLGGPGQTLHLIWVDRLSDQYRTRHSLSRDGGHTWSVTSNIITVEGEIPPVATVIDRAGQVHFLQVEEQGLSSPQLRYMTWWDGKWSERTGLPLRAESPDEISMVRGLVDSGDRLVVAYVGPGLRDSSMERTPELVYVGIPIGMPTSAEIEASITSELGDDRSEVLTETPLPTSAAPLQPDPKIFSEGSDKAPNTNPVNVVVIVIVVVSALIVVVVMAIRHRRMT